MVAKSNAFANHMYMKLNGIGAKMGKPNWYVRNVAKKTLFIDYDFSKKNNH